MNDPRPPPAPPPDWLPRHPTRVRWDRSLVVGEAAYRWHSRLDGTALLHGPAGHLAVGDTVAMPVGHLHKPGEVRTARYVITDLHADEHGRVFLRAERDDAR